MSKFFAATLALAAVANGAAVRESVAGQFIVVLNDNVTTAQKARHMEKVSASFAGAQVMNEFEIGDSFKAYVMQGDDMMMADIMRDSAVKYIQPDYVDHIYQDSCTTDTNTDSGLWGLQRTNLFGRVSATNPIPRNYNYNTRACGEGVDLYILDTGIQTTNVDFAGRASWIGDFTTERSEVDGNGHGTHVASSAGGEKYGMAKCSNMYALKVCTSGGSCPSSAQLGAIQRVGQDAATGRKIVANMSLGGFGRNTATLDAIEAAHKQGAMFVVASGNSNDNSCSYSPAQSPYAMTIDSSDSSDRRSSFSNYGACSQIFAPGSNIKAAWIGANTATRTISGTSMASPHAAGAAAAMWSSNSALSPKGVEAAMIDQAQDYVITNSGANSHEKSLYMPCSN